MIVFTHPKAASVMGYWQLRYERYTLEKELRRPAFKPKRPHHELKALAKRPKPQRPGPVRLSLCIYHFIPSMTFDKLSNDPK